jgi:protein involved in polysaccharide export with SLBB domain
MFRLPRLRTGLGLALLLAAVARPAAAQNPRDQAKQATATRDELENMALEAEQIAAAPGSPEKLRREKLAAAASIRERLRNGDFQTGDRIVLKMTGDPNFPPIDTVTVRTGSVLQIDRLGEISLRGVLRAELSAHMKREVTKIVRGATVQANSVIRLGTFGQVGQPGFYEFPSEGLMSEVLNRARLPADADQHNITISRGGTEIWSRQAVDVALQEGISLEQLGLRNGDQIMVGQKRDVSAQIVLQYFMIGFQLVNTILIISTRR